MKLTPKQIQCLEHVSNGQRLPFKITTIESLARKGFVEHAALGWRLTPEGAQLLAKQRAT